jgi:pilus assembly protein Flp/PilA
MKKALVNTVRFLKSEKGQGMVEYGLIIALVAIAVIAAIVLLGDNIKAIFTTTTDALSLASSAS